MSPQFQVSPMELTYGVLAEFDRVRKDPHAAADIAKRLLSLPASEFTDWELDFLRSIRRLRDKTSVMAPSAEAALKSTL